MNPSDGPPEDCDSPPYSSGRRDVFNYSPLVPQAPLPPIAKKRTVNRRGITTVRSDLLLTKQPRTRNSDVSGSQNSQSRDGSVKVVTSFARSLVIPAYKGKNGTPASPTKQATPQFASLSGPQNGSNLLALMEASRQAVTEAQSAPPLVSPYFAPMLDTTVKVVCEPEKVISVLIVDDQRSIVKLMKKRFENDCFDVDTAKNGIEALAKMQNTIYTMVFLDIHMEPMDGITCCRSLRNWELSVNRMERQRICAMSGDTDAEFIARCKHFFNDFAGKPININKLINLAKSPTATFETVSDVKNLDRRLPSQYGEGRTDFAVSFAPGVTCEVRSVSSDIYISATISSIDPQGFYKVIKSNESTEEGVSTIRIRYQTQVQPKKLIVGQRVECNSRIEGMEGDAYIDGVVINQEKKDNNDEDIYTVQYPEHVGVDGISKENLPRSRILSQCVWPRRKRVTKEDMKKASSTQTSFKSALDKQLGLVQEVLDLSGAPSTPKNKGSKEMPRKLSIVVDGEKEVRGNKTCPTPKRTLGSSAGT